MEIPFYLPVGLRDAAGAFHREGVMRRALAADEIDSLQDSRVRTTPAYLPIIVLSRVVLRIGAFAPVPPEVIQVLYAQDFHYLQEVYLEINGYRLPDLVEAQCPNCGARLVLDVTRSLTD